MTTRGGCAAWSFCQAVHSAQDSGSRGRHDAHQGSGQDIELERCVSIQLRQKMCEQAIFTGTILSWSGGVLK